MLAEVGSILVALALAVAIYATCVGFWSIRRSDSRWALSARNGVYATVGLLALALLLLLFAFLDDQFQIRYVAEHSSRALPLYLKISAVWAGQEGSLLLWAFLQALFAALVVGRPSERMRPLLPWAMVFLNLITAFFTGVTLFLSSPFVPSPTMLVDGHGLNPLLRHPGMIFHPPAMYLGYVGLAAPFAFALAALVTRQVDEWPVAARRWTLVAWIFLGVGLLLGARWAYDVLGWGGYWGWDPVENAGLMPWLTTTALLHSMVMQEQRGGFRWWNLLLAVFSFALVLFGTFTTRSGLIQSVHAFARSNLGPYFLAAIGVTLGGSLALMISRRAILTDPRPVEGLLSRDGMFLLTLVLFLTITGSVLVGSLLPTLTDALSGWRFEAGPEWFDRVTGPQFAALLLLMGVCPLLARAAGDLRRLRSRGWPALLGVFLVVGVAAWLGFTRPVSLVGFAVVGLSGATTLTEYVRAVIARSRRSNENPLQALWRLFGRNRRKYGGYLVHAGVILMGLGIIGTRMYSYETVVVLSPGESADVEGYTLVYEDFSQEMTTDHMRTWASFDVYRDEAYLTTLRPQMDQYPDFVDQTATTPALRVGLREDLYTILAGWEGDGAAVTLKVFVNPLVSFLWLGGLVFLAGGAVALGPVQTARRGVPAPDARRRAIGTAVGLTVGLLVLVAAGVAMWGTGTGTAAPDQPNSARPAPIGSTSQPAGRPRPGQTAPDFTLSLLDGSTVTLSDLSDQVVVINFWATWCLPCEEELPDFQAVWDEYQERDIVFVGIAVQGEEEIAEVEEMVARFGVTYPLGLDRDGDIFTAYGITGVPETFVVDIQGRVAYVHVGPVSAEMLRADLDTLLEEK
ncbi:MAG: cytochrome c-type biogenesis CcmF C-terminal domain-containing protein [Chloroflexota bacterium]|nr:cytochrome c-type biogenesis CcmF C-terminal domain-containing protein [Chloroflexota bacterium]